MTRNLAVATGAIFAITAVLAVIGNSPLMEVCAIAFSVLSFAVYLLLRDHGIH